MLDDGRCELRTGNNDMGETSDAPAPAMDGDFAVTRTFDAPRERVFEAWTEPGRLMRWFGPQGMTMPACTMDLRPSASPFGRRPAVLRKAANTSRGGDIRCRRLRILAAGE